MNTFIVTALLAFVACANAGLAPAYYHHHHAPVFAAPVPIVKHVQPIYAVHPPILAKPVVYAPAPVVKVVHGPPVVKTVAFGPLGYGHYHDHHHHHFF